MKRMLGNLQRRASPANDASNDGPLSTLTKEVKAFCETAGGPAQSSDDYIHLPAIVEAAESSPRAAKEAVSLIRGYLAKPSKPQGHSQYNAVMLIRILVDHPGASFTRNFDTKFVNTIKTFLREGRDMNAQAMLRETLHAFEVQRQWDESLKELLAMWRRENERSKKSGTQTFHPPSHSYNPNVGNGQQQQPQRRSKVLPPPDELAARIAEAKTSADLLIQLAQTTPASEVASHELLKEFCERCQSASKSVQGYINCNDPAPDEDTMLTLIETNERLSVALSKYHRTVLQARRTMSNNSGTGSGTVTPNAHDNNTQTHVPNHSHGNNGLDRSGSVQSPVSTLSRTSSDIGNRTYNTFSSGDSIPFRTENRNVASVQSYSVMKDDESNNSMKMKLSIPIPLGSNPTPSTETRRLPAFPSTEYDPDEWKVDNPFADPEEHDQGDRNSHGHIHGETHARI